MTFDRHEPCKSKRISLEQPASDFLQSKFSTGNPVCMYAALRIWDDYLRMRELYRNRELTQDIFMVHESRLTMAFLLEPPLEYDPETGRPKAQNISSHSFRGVNREEAQLSLWYPAVKNKTAGPKEFSDWLYQQSHIIAELAEFETKQNL